jgi:hypothetical protein
MEGEVLEARLPHPVRGQAMHRDDLDMEWELPGPAEEEEMVLEIGDEMVSSRDEVDSDTEWPAGSTPEEGFTVDGPASRIANAGLDDLLDDFVELVNARDLEGLTEVLAPDVTAGFLDSTSRFGVMDGLNEFVLRNSTLMATRADLGSEPIAALWIFDQEEAGYDLVGYLTFEMTDSNELIQRLDYVEELPAWKIWSSRRPRASRSRNGRSGRPTTSIQLAPAAERCRHKALLRRYQPVVAVVTVVDDVAPVGCGLGEEQESRADGFETFDCLFDREHRRPALRYDDPCRARPRIDRRRTQAGQTV